VKAFFTEEQFLHDPQQFMRVGRISKPTDLPARAHALRDALAARGIALEEPKDYGREPLEAVHSVDYLDFLASAYEEWRQLKVPGVEPGIEVLPNLSPYYNGRLDEARPPCPAKSLIARTGYYVGDLACPIGASTWRSVLRSAHAATAAADAVLADDGQAYALCRPSGHHAHRDRAGGFCYVNNSAVAAQRLRQRYSRVAVVDVDAHHGDGTQNIFYTRGDVFTISIHADPSTYYPFYTGYADERGAGAGEGRNLNLPLAHGAGNRELLEAVDTALATLGNFSPEALVVPLGFDSYKDDPISVLRADMDAYQQIGARIGRLELPTVIVQEGGYKVDAIGQALEKFLQGLAGD
jgi:acetoin utilization deacetylase AcuC-like enzyme